MAIMGQIIDQPKDNTSQDNWALVKGTTVTSLIVANLPFIQSIQGNYDFLVDIDVGNNSANCQEGSTYNVQQDTFSPPPTDWAQVIQSDLDSVFNALLQCVSDAAQASGQQIQNGINAATSDNTPNFSINMAILWPQIITWLNNGG